MTPEEVQEMINQHYRKKNGGCLSPILIGISIGLLLVAIYTRIESVELKVKQLQEFVVKNARVIEQ